MFITQSESLEPKKVEIFKKNFGYGTQIHLPTNIFFENSGTYISTNGNFNKMTKIITSSTQTKSDWQIVRKVFSYCKKIFFILKNNTLIFNSNIFKKYLIFQYYAIPNLNNSTFQGFKKIKPASINFLRFKPKRNIFINSQLKY